MKLGPKQKQWITALRSGKYIQGRSALSKKNDDGNFCYCCLGVLLEDLQLAPYEIQLDKKTYPTVSGGDIFNESDILPEGLSKEIGLYSDHGTPIPGSWKDSTFDEQSKHYQITGFTTPRSIVALNDEHQKSFDVIADLLETFPEVFFTHSV